MSNFYGYTADQVIAVLELQPHPEGGYFKEIYRDAVADGERGTVTSIFLLLEEGQVSHWHRVVDAAEVWCWHAGAPLELLIQAEGGQRQTHYLGMDLNAGQRPQAVVPAGAWQSAKSLGAWTLVGCQVAPAFQFESFVLAEPGFEPN